MDFAIARLGKLVAEGNLQQYMDDAETCTRDFIRDPFKRKLADARTRMECEIALKVAEAHLACFYFYAFYENGVRPMLQYITVGFNDWSHLFKTLCEQRVAKLESAVCGVVQASS
jgi:hypothetical protein